MSQTSNNKRIAKNTLMLYFRMILIMAVTLYSSRVILEVLGVEDYGTFNVVGGVITTLSFITGSLGGATSRFLTFELGKGNSENVEKVFRTANTIYYAFSAIFLIIAETVGLWFVNTYLEIPEGREIAVQFVYQCSVITFIISIISIPYNALIIAQEHMNAFAYISIYEAIAKLAILFILPAIGGDSLIWYSILLMLVQVSVRIIYNVYCNKQFKESTMRWLWDKELIKSMFSYSWWTMNGYLAMVGYTQGLNILLNIFFGPVVNAARAISVQVQSALEQFFGNITMAIKPQAIKQYAQGNLEYMHVLVLKAGRISFLMSILVAIPLLMYTEYIMNLWLVNPPEHTVTFVRLMLIAGISGSLKQHTIMSIHATGDIKKFQIYEGSFLLLIVPIGYCLAKFFNASPEAIILSYVIIEILSEFLRVLLVYPKIDLKIKFFFSKVLNKCFAVLGILSIPTYLMYKYAQPDNFISFLILTLSVVIIEIIAIYIVGLEQDEKAQVKLILKKIRR